MVYLETNRLILRDYTESDADAYFELRSDPKTMYYLQGIQLFTKAAAVKDFQKILEDSRSINRKFYFLQLQTAAEDRRTEIRKTVKRYP